MLLNWRNLYCIRAENAFNHSTLNLLILTKIYVVAYQFCLIFDEKSNFEIINAIFSSYQKLKQESNTFHFLFFTHQLMIQILSLGVELNRFLLNVRNSKRSAEKWVCAWSPHISFCVLGSFHRPFPAKIFLWNIEILNNLWYVLW